MTVFHKSIVRLTLPLFTQSIQKLKAALRRPTGAWVPAPPRAGLMFAHRLGWSALAVALAMGIAGYACFTYWSLLFGAVYPPDRVLSSEDMAIKPLVNITMYAIPSFFYAGAMGAFCVGYIGLLVNAVGQWVDNWRAQRRGIPSCD
ncbi:TPA: hypothetical protein ACNV4G_003318 [Serratia marcescens]|nr:MULTISPECIES: hypothetical protein [Serratia]RYM48281.1 hypothetical protein BSQ96_21900 [Serratia proteamaculans]